MTESEVLLVGRSTSTYTGPSLGSPGVKVNNFHNYSLYTLY